MPYNLRKRAAPEPVEPVVKKPRVKKAPKAAKVKDEPVKEQVPEPTKETGKTKEPHDVKASPEVEVPKDVKVSKTTKKAKKVQESQKVEEVEQVQSLTRCQYLFGIDGCGEFGLGKIGFTKNGPTKLPIDGAIKQVACGPMHTITLTEDGQVYSYGCNDEGALGRITDGDCDLESTPTPVPLPNQVEKVTAGDSHSAALTTKSEVFIWGNFRDEHGSIGLTPECSGEATFKPIQISPETKFMDIASGSNHMLLLDTDGVVYSFGVGAQGQLGRLTSEDVGENSTSSYPITAENRDLFLTPKKVSLKDVDPARPFVCDAIYAGNNSSFATNTDKKKNRLAGWGLNNYHQLGYKGQKGDLVQHRPKRSTFTCSTSMIDVACGQHHTLFLTKSGRVYSAGRHDYGMLGLGKISKEICPAKRVDALCDETITNIDAGINTSFAVSDEGKLYAWGMSGPQLGVSGEEDLLEPTVVKSLEKKRVISVSTEGEFTAVVAEG